MKNLATVALLLFTNPCLADLVLPNGSDDTDAINAELDARGQVTFLSGGQYKINCSGVRLNSGNRLLAAGATLKLINTNVPRCRMFETAIGAQNILVQGGTMVGDRTVPAEWQILFRVDGAHNVKIEGVVFDGAGTDNLWIGGNGAPSTNVRVVKTTFKNARRNGVSAVYLHKGIFHQNIFEGTRGAESPVAGLNLEPNSYEYVSDITITQNTFRNNAGPGIYAHIGNGLPGTGYVVANNFFQSNGRSAIIFSRITKGSITNNTIRSHLNRATPAVVIGDQSSDIDIHGNRLEGNFGGLYIQISSRINVTKNTIRGYVGDVASTEIHRSYGIRIQGDPNTSTPADDVAIRDNDVIDVRYVGIHAVGTTRTEMEANRVSGTGHDGIWLQQCQGCAVLNNSIAHSGQRAANTYHDVLLSHVSVDNQIYGNSVTGTSTRKALWIQPDSRDTVFWGNSFGGPERLEYPAVTTSTLP
jgi:parallel beta-helix repeat protein